MGNITLPYTITNGQTTDANKVMANLNAIIAEVNGNLESVNIKDLAVITDKLAALAVTAAKIATDAVETLKIKDANVTAVKLATDSVETLKIKDVNVTAAKLATDSVETLKIKDLNVTTGKLDADAVTNPKIADDAVQAENVLGLTGTGTVSLDNVPDGTTYQKVHGDYVDASGKIDTIKAANVSYKYQFKCLTIGNWNMDSTETLNVAHGFGVVGVIRGVFIMIHADTGAATYPFPYPSTDGSYVDGSFMIDATNVVLHRRTGGFFDSNTDFDNPSYARGYVIVMYEV